MLFLELADAVLIFFLFPSTNLAIVDALRMYFQDITRQTVPRSIPETTVQNILVSME